MILHIADKIEHWIAERTCYWNELLLVETVSIPYNHEINRIFGDLIFESAKIYWMWLFFIYLCFSHSKSISRSAVSKSELPAWRRTSDKLGLYIIPRCLLGLVCSPPRELVACRLDKLLHHQKVAVICQHFLTKLKKLSHRKMQEKWEKSIALLWKGQ